MTKLETFCPSTRAAWREWLLENHLSKPSIWIIFNKKNSSAPSISWSNAVDEALCFGWVDSRRNAIDADTFRQFFSKRKPTSTWSKINKEKVRQLTRKKLMMPAGLACIKIAKRNGTWTILDSVEELDIPGDLKREFRMHPGAGKFFLSLSKSVQKSMLQWIVLAKRDETRKKRISEVAKLAGEKLKPRQF